jgi:hypothetical protein
MFDGIPCTLCLTCWLWWTLMYWCKHKCLNWRLMVYPAHYAWQGIQSNVTSGTCFYISTSRSIKVNKSGIVWRLYHQTSLQALLFTLVHQGRTSMYKCKHKCLKWPLMVYPAHYAWLVDFDGPWCTNVNTSAWSDVWWYTLYTMPDFTSVYISTSRSIKVNKSGIVCRVYHQTSLQALVFTLVHQGPSKATSQA